MTDRSVLLKRETYASVSVASTLMLFKLWAWWMTDSISLLASLMDSATDMLASGINLLAVRYAMLEADDNHHFGHGKAESLSALAQAMFIAGSSLFLIVNASGRLFRPVAITNDAVGIGVMLVSMVMTAALVLYQRSVLERVDSPSVRADSLNYVNDLMTTAGVLLALILAALGWHMADPLIAIAVGIYMLSGVWKILSEAVSALMDVALPPEEMARVQAAIASVPGSEGVHRLRARRHGEWRMVDMHLEFDDDVSLLYAHEVNDHVEEAIAACFDGPVEIMIHMEPKSVAHDDKHKLG